MKFWNLLIIGFTVSTALAQSTVNGSVNDQIRGLIGQNPLQLQVALGDNVKAPVFMDLTSTVTPEGLTVKLPAAPAMQPYLFLFRDSKNDYPAGCDFRLNASSNTALFFMTSFVKVNDPEASRITLVNASQQPVFLFFASEPFEVTGTVTCERFAESYTLNVDAGWNMISVVDQVIDGKYVSTYKSLPAGTTLIWVTAQNSGQK